MTGTALSPAQVEFATFSNDAPKVVKVLDEGIGSVLNGAIEKCGALGDACTKALREDTGKIKIGMGNGGLPGDPSSMPPIGQGKSENVQVQARTQEKVIAPPTREIQLAVSTAGVSDSISKGGVDIPDGTMVAPMAAAGRMDTRSMGIG